MSCCLLKIVLDYELEILVFNFGLLLTSCVSFEFFCFKNEEDKERFLRFFLI